MVDVLEFSADPDGPDVPAMLDPQDHGADPDPPHIPDVADVADVAADPDVTTRPGTVVTVPTGPTGRIGQVRQSARMHPNPGFFSSTSFYRSPDFLTSQGFRRVQFADKVDSICRFPGLPGLLVSCFPRFRYSLSPCWFGRIRWSGRTVRTGRIDLICKFSRNNPRWCRLHLAGYDVEAARSLLSENAEDVLPPRLRHALLRLVANLQMYKPYLINPGVHSPSRSSPRIQNPAYVPTPLSRQKPDHDQCHQGLYLCDAPQSILLRGGGNAVAGCLLPSAGSTLSRRSRGSATPQRRSTLSRRSRGSAVRQRRSRGSAAPLTPLAISASAKTRSLPKCRASEQSGGSDPLRRQVTDVSAGHAPRVQSIFQLRREGTGDTAPSSAELTPPVVPLSRQSSTIKSEPRQKMLSLIAVNRHGFLSNVVQVPSYAAIPEWLARQITAFEDDVKIQKGVIDLVIADRGFAS
eukprot:gene2947-biopygen3102